MAVVDDETRWNQIHQKHSNPADSHSKYAEEKEKLFPRNSLIVDFGAGTGSDVMYFLTKGHRVVALDISTYALSVLQERAKNLGFVKQLVVKQMDFGLQKVPIKDSSVDIAYSRISLNYFGAKQTAKLLTDIYRTLRQGGTAYLTFKSPDDFAEMEHLKKVATVYEENVFIEAGMLRSRFTHDQLRNILKNSGIPNFEVKAHKEDISHKGTSHLQHLFVNEIIFSKA